MRLFPAVFGLKKQSKLDSATAYVRGRSPRDWAFGHYVQLVLTKVCAWFVEPWGTVSVPRGGFGEM